MATFPNKNWLSPFLLYYEALHSSGEGKIFIYNFLCCTQNWIDNSSEMFSLVTLLSAKIGTLIESTISGVFVIEEIAWPVFILNTISTFFKQFSPFVNIYSTKNMLFHTHHTFDFNFTWFALLNHQRFDDRPLFKPETLCYIWHHVQDPQNKYSSEIKIVFALKQ